MIDFKYADLYKQDSIDKQLLISYDTGTITNKDIHYESMELSESLCSTTQLRFGSCEASILKFKVSNIISPLIGKKLHVSETLEGNTDTAFSFGIYKVQSDKPAADRSYRDITAYDAMYDIINAEVSDWFNSLTFPMTLKQFRNSFFEYLNISQSTTELLNDDMTVTETIRPSQLSGKDVITAICEVNACFGHINHDGTFCYKYLNPIERGIYPAENLYPDDDLFPSNSNGCIITKSFYKSCQYEDFITEKITKLQIRTEENDVGIIYGNGDNCYVIEGNFLLYGKGTDELTVISKRIFDKINRITYRPCTVKANGNPCLEVGDGIRLNTTSEIIDTYILCRTLTGIQALEDTYEAQGEERQSENVNSVKTSIIQLRGKTNTLTRTVEETKLEIKDIESGLSSRITQNAESISAEVTRATKSEATLTSKITQTAESITTEVKRATQAEGTLSSQIAQNAESITTKVTKGNISSEISQEAGKITIKSNRFELQSTNLSITDDGTLKAKNGEFTGKIVSTDATITGGTINISSAASGYSTIQLRSSSGSCGMDSYGIRVIYNSNMTTIGGSGSSFSGNVTFQNVTVNGAFNVDSIDSSITFNKATTFAIGSTHTVKGSFVSSGSFIVNGTSGKNFESSGAFARVGYSSGYVGFFGGNGSTKKTISALPSTATLANCISKIEEIRNALKAYNLIG